MPLGTVNVGDTFSISLKDSGTFETVTVTANSTDNTPSLVNVNRHCTVRSPV